MPRPATTPFQEDLYAYLETVAVQDESLGWPLLKYCGAIAAMFDQIETYARDRATGEPGWSILMDPDVAPDDGSLEWLAQFVGVVLDITMTTAQKRAAIKGLSAFQRGTPAALAAAAARYLTGTKTVFVAERAGGAYYLAITTYTAETPDPAKVLAELLKQKPAGIILTYSNVVGGDYATFAGTHSDYTQIVTRYIDYAEVLSNPIK